MSARLIYAGECGLTTGSGNGPDAHCCSFNVFSWYLMQPVTPREELSCLRPGSRPPPPPPLLLHIVWFAACRDSVTYLIFALQRRRPTLSQHNMWRGGGAKCSTPWVIPMGVRRSQRQGLNNMRPSLLLSLPPLSLSPSLSLCTVLTASAHLFSAWELSSGDFKLYGSVLSVYTMSRLHVIWLPVTSAVYASLYAACAADQLSSCCPVQQLWVEI